jgi:hypothetical protein
MHRFGRAPKGLQQHEFDEIFQRMIDRDPHTYPSDDNAFKERLYAVGSFYPSGYKFKDIKDKAWEFEQTQLDKMIVSGIPITMNHNTNVIGKVLDKLPSQSGRQYCTFYVDDSTEEGKMTQKAMKSLDMTELSLKNQYSVLGKSMTQTVDVVAPIHISVVKKGQKNGCKILAMVGLGRDKKITTVRAYVDGKWTEDIATMNDVEKQSSASIYKDSVSRGLTTRSSSMTDTTASVEVGEPLLADVLRSIKEIDKDSTKFDPEDIRILSEGSEDPSLFKDASSRVMGNFAVQMRQLSQRLEKSEQEKELIAKQKAEMERNVQDSDKDVNASLMNSLSGFFDTIKERADTTKHNGLTNGVGMLQKVLQSQPIGDKIKLQEFFTESRAAMADNPANSAHGINRFNGQQSRAKDEVVRKRFAEVGMFRAPAEKKPKTISEDLDFSL